MNKHPGKLVIDLDGVIAGSKPADGTYGDCAVNGPIVKRLRELKKLGWTITINTSRNVRSFDNNIGRIIAETVPAIIDWLTEHDVPYDEIIPGKPWTGTVGFYVDDRAVLPQDFLRLTTSELLARARGAVFDPSEPGWQVGSDQSWNVADLRNDSSRLLSSGLAELISEQRDVGARTALLLNGRERLPIGYDEQLVRLGVRIARFDAHLPITEAGYRLKRELILEGLASSKSFMGILTLPSERDVRFGSRHFNSVRAHEDRVSKCSSQDAKLDFEYLWLLQATQACRHEVVIGGLEERPEGCTGYVMNRGLGGSLSDVLLRSLEHPAMITAELEALWNNLNDYHPRALELTSNSFWATKDQLQHEHERLYISKTETRLALLGKLGKQLGFDLGTPWIVNGVNLGSIRTAVGELVNRIPVQRNDHRGVWHGDFCPGNMVFTKALDDDGAKLVMIDPRGTIDGVKVSFFGDQRYDLGKLAHALRWGYDSLVSGWFDVHAQVNVDSFNVSLRLWDEDAPEEPLRVAVWKSLIANEKITAGPVKLDDPTIYAITALQLITCSPLHSDDHDRVIALIARGLEVALQAKQQPTKSVTKEQTHEEA